MSDNRVEINPFNGCEYFFKTTGLLVSMDDKGNANVMALDWKTIGDLWYHPIITIAVAYNRYTYELLDKYKDEFTLNIPTPKINHVIDIAGSHSGRNIDKIKKANLKMIPGKKVSVPTIADCLLSYECKVLGSSKAEFKTSHHLFFGEILNAYASRELIS